MKLIQRDAGPRPVDRCTIRFAALFKDLHGLGGITLQFIFEGEKRADARLNPDFLCPVALKQEYPEQEAASVLMEPRIPYDYLIQVMDIVRSVEVPTDVEDEFELYALFTDISVGEAP